MCKRRVSVNNEEFWMTYILNSAPVCNSGHTMWKRRVTVNNVMGEVFRITYSLNSAQEYNIWTHK